MKNHLKAATMAIAFAANSFAADKMKILRIITGSLLLAHVCSAAETKVATPQGRPLGYVFAGPPSMGGTRFFWSDDGALTAEPSFTDALLANEDIIARNVTADILQRHIKPIFA